MAPELEPSLSPHDKVSSAADSSRSSHESDAESVRSQNSSASSSAWRVNIELSLPTQRRLIRKPLPDLPGEGSSRTSSAIASRMAAGSARKPRAKLLAEEERKACDWWPESLPALELAGTAEGEAGGVVTVKGPDESQSAEPSSEGNGPSPQGVGLDYQSKEHLRLLLQYALPQSSSGNLSATETPATFSSGQAAGSIFESLLQAARHVSAPEVLSSLQRTASVRWRAEAQLRSSSSTSAASGSNATSRWGRLGWPAAALSRGYVLGYSGQPSAFSHGMSDGDSEAFGINSEDQPRVRKRDIAIKILSNAVWLARMYGPSGASDLPTQAQGAIEEEKGDATVKEKKAETQIPLAMRRRGGPPSFVPRSAPTTALSAMSSLQPSPCASSGAPSPAALSGPPSPASESSSNVIEDEDKSENDGFAADLTPTPSVIKPQSKAVERLASLNAAAGAALAAQAKAYAELHPATDGLPESNGPPSLLKSRQSSFMSIRSTASRFSTSEAERKETEALELAEKEYMARFGEGCSFWTRMVICRLCVHLTFDAEEGKEASTPTTKSATTTCSWKPDMFEGDDLFGQAAPPKLDGEGADRIRVVGGTFFVHAETETEARWVRTILETMTYSMCAMLLEAALLADSGVPRPQPPTPPPIPESSLTSMRDQVENSTPVRLSIDSSAVASTSQAEDDDATTPVQGPRTSKRWTRGLWNMWGGKASGSGSTPVGSLDVEPSASRPSLQESRDNGTADIEARPGLIRTFTAGSESTLPGQASPSKKAHVRMGKLMHPFGAGKGKVAGLNGTPSTQHSSAESSDSKASSSSFSSTSSSKASSVAASSARPSLELTPVEKSIHSVDWPTLDELSWPPPSSVSPELSQIDRQSRHTPLMSEKLILFESPRSFLNIFGGRQHLRLQLEGRSSPIAFGSDARRDFDGRTVLPNTSANSRNLTISSTTSTTVSGIPSVNSHSSSVNTALSTGTEPSHAATLAALPVHNETIGFYARIGSGRDAPLGQVIEEMCAHAEVGEVGPSGDAADVKRKEAGAAGERAGGSKILSTQNAQTNVLRFVHGSHRITVSVKTLPSSSFGKDPLPSLEEEKNSASSAEKTDANASVSSKADLDADIAAVAAALQTDRHSARTAVNVAETAVKLAEGCSAIDSSSQDGPGTISMWNADISSGTQTAAIRMSEATYLMSFAHYLELLLFHPALRNHKSLQDLTTLTPKQNLTSIKRQLRDGAERPLALPDAHYNIARFFRSSNALVKIVIKPIQIFDFLIDGPTIVARRPENDGRPAPLRTQSQVSTSSAATADASSETTKIREQTRHEIQDFFTSIKTHITRLEDCFVSRELDEHGKTMKVPKTSPVTSEDDETIAGDDQVTIDSLVTTPTGSTFTNSPAPEPLTLLTKLKLSLRSDEFELYALLKETTIDHINDIRKHFSDRAKSARNRLAAWTRKHLTKTELSELGEPKYVLPDYTQAGHHTFPGSRYVVREDEPLSIIAFSLSSRDFKAELLSELKADHVDDLVDKRSDVLNWRSGVVDIGDGRNSLSSAASSKVSGVSSSAASLRHKAPAGPGPLDPDRDEVFYTPEPVNVHMKRKKRGREGSILSLRLRRVRSSLSQTSGTRSTPQTPATEVTVELGEGVDPAHSSASSSVGGGDESVADAIADLSADMISIDGPAVQSQVGSSFRSSTISSAATNSTFRANITHTGGRPASLASIFSKDPQDSDTRSETGSQTEERNISLASSSLNALWSIGSGFHSFKNRQQRDADTTTDSVGADTVDGGDLGSHGTTQPRSLPTTPQTLQVPRPMSVVESPHIKHNLFHGSTKVSCVSWFAAEFAALRSKWGVGSDFAESLSRCHTWNASGGKSKSLFFKTHDEKFIAKQLLTVWSVDEKEAFLEFAPAYIKYMMNSVVNDSPTLLVKIAGVYSLKIKDMRSGETKLKMNVMLLENLFAGEDGASCVRFDLKGIRDRRVKTSFSTEDGSSVWWDGEWIDNYKSRAFVAESQKDRFREALHNDLQFLTASNVMDYSLLLGVQEPIGTEQDGSTAQSPSPTLRVRIVDYIGAFTLAKQLESSSKKALKSGPEAKSNVTILPPHEYAERFSAAMESYFVACPEESTRGHTTLRATPLINSPPAVL